MQQPWQMFLVTPSFPPTNITTEQIQKYLDENKKLILAILDNQNLGKLAELASARRSLCRPSTRISPTLPNFADDTDAQQTPIGDYIFPLSTEDFKDSVHRAALNLGYNESKTATIMASFILHKTRERSPFTKAALKTLESICALEQFLMTHKKDYLDLRRTTEQERDSIEHEVTVFINSCKEQIDVLKNSINDEESNSKGWLGIRSDNLNADTIAHKHGVVLILSEKLHSVTSKFDQLRAIRFQDAINKVTPRRKLKSGIKNITESSNLQFTEANNSKVGEANDFQAEPIGVQQQVLDDETRSLQAVEATKNVQLEHEHEESCAAVPFVLGKDLHKSLPQVLENLTLTWDVVLQSCSHQNVVNEIIGPIFHYWLSGFMVFIQHWGFAFEQIFVEQLWIQMVPMQTIRSRFQFIKISALSFIFCASVVSGNISLRYLPVSFNQAIGATTPFFTAVFAYLITFKREAWLTYVTLIPVVTGVIIASGGEPSFHLFGFIMCVGATAARALKSVVQGILLSSEGEKLNSMNLLMYMAPIAVVLLIPTTLLMEENVVGITLALARDDIRIVWLLLFNSALAYFVNLTNFLVTKHTSALTLQVLGNAKGAVAVVISILIFRNPVSVTGMLGYSLTVIGVILYSEAKKRSK
ncbi:unnamed protein product [Fraxinus pennsylvanica]|uniref:Sugar phosphate transporter domain-containing protein n=1 Tax=Fraxinus pennsylvanica TaxID=56036 RepID=A0AAD2E2X5_9LAMI|nr:unnamed protein product [Fraxinus pennsylvanica]